MKNRILILIALVLFVSAGMWSLVYSGGVSVNRTPSIDDDGTNVIVNATLTTTPATPATNVSGQQMLITGQKGGACSSCGEGSPSGGFLRIQAGDGGDGDGSVAASGGAVVFIEGGDAGADGGGGGGTGGGIDIRGGVGTNGTDGTVLIGQNTTSMVRIGAGQLPTRLDGRVGHNASTIALTGAAVTFAPNTNFLTLTGDAGANTVATITGMTVGGTLTIVFTDALVTITDDNTHVADSIDLSAAFTSADDTTLTLVYDGTSWYETSRSVN